MWIIPRRHFWSHSLVLAPLRLVYFYLVTLLIVVWGAWLLGRIGVSARSGVGVALRCHAAQPRYGAPVHSWLHQQKCGAHYCRLTYDWGKCRMQMIGICLRHNYRNHNQK